MNRHEQITRALANGARSAAPVVAALVAVAVLANAIASIVRLFARAGADPLSQALAAAASVGVLVALVGVLYLAESPSLRALAAIYAVAWIPLVLSLVALDAALGYDVVTPPPALLESGRTVAALLAGIALLPVATLAVASRRASDGDLRQELAYYTGNALKLVLLVATSAATLAFGLRRGVPVEVSVFVAVVLEISFVIALLRSREQALLHPLAMIIFGGAIGLVAVETLGTLSGLAALPELARIGEAIYLLVPALAIGYIVGGQLAARGESPRLLRLLARMLGDLRADWAAVRGEARGEARAREVARNGAGKA